MKTFVSQNSRVKVQPDKSAHVLFRNRHSASRSVVKETHTLQSTGQGQAGGSAAC